MKNERPVMKSLKNFIAERFDGEIQMFDCRNTVGDSMETIFYKDGVTVDYCHRYEYIEIFGLTDEEFNELNDQFGTDKRWQKKIVEVVAEAKAKEEEELEERIAIRKRIEKLKEETKNDLIGLYQAGYDRGYEEARKEAIGAIVDTRVQAELAGYERGIKDKSVEDWNDGFNEGWEDGHNAGKGEVFEEVSNILETTTDEYELIEALYAMMEEKKK